MRLLALIAFVVTTTLSGQGLLRSYVMQEDTARACTLTIRSFEKWEDPVDHVFRVSIATYLLPGDYLVRYYMDTTWLHAEWIHISTKWVVIEKTILPKPIPLHLVRFLPPKKNDEYGVYIKSRGE